MAISTKISLTDISLRGIINRKREIMKNLSATEKYRRTRKGVLTNSYGHQKARRPVEYSLAEFQGAFLNDIKFNRLYGQWLNSGCNRQLKPTVDRINCKKGYTLDNIQCLTWAENRYKQRMEIKMIRARTVYMVLGDKIVNIFKSVTDAVRKTGLHQGNISSCLHGHRKTCGGYGWSYENPELLTAERPQESNNE